MVGRQTGIVGGGGGGADLSNYVTLAMLDENYVSKAFLNGLFAVHMKVRVKVTDPSTTPATVISDTTTEQLLLPNATVPDDTTETDSETGYVTATTYTLDSIQALAGLWTNSYVSALGQNDSGGGGGGGGASALSQLVDVQLSSLSNGQMLIYDSAQGKWINANIPVSGGTVTSVGVAPVSGSHLNVTGSPVTTSGTINIGLESGYSIPSNAKQSNWDSAYSWVQTSRTTLAAYGITDAYTKSEIATILSDYATKLWVENKGYITSSAISDMATKTWVATVLADYATKTWVGQQGYLTSSALSSYLPLSGGTMTGLIVRASSGWWVKGRDNAVIKQTDGGVSGHGWAPVFSAKTLLGSWELGTISEQGEKLILAYTTDSDYNNNVNTASILFFPTGSGTLARLSDNVASATKLQTARTLWGQSFDGTSDVSGNMSNVGSIAANGEIKTSNANAFRLSYGNYGVIMRNDGDGFYILATNNGGADSGSFNNLRPFKFYLNGTETDRNAGLCEMGNGLFLIGTNGVAAGSGSTNSGFNALRIGNGVIMWDSTNNALRIQSYDGTAGSIYATGGVSALGMSAGVSSIDSMTFGYLTVSNKLYFGNTSRYIQMTTGGVCEIETDGAPLFLHGYHETYIDEDGWIYCPSLVVTSGGINTLIANDNSIDMDGTIRVKYNGQYKTLNMATAISLGIFS